jgi:Flp pilus assembly protein TadG
MRRDDGMVTAELAVCLPVLMLILAVALGAVSIADARVRAQDAASVAARAAARGDSAEARHLFEQTAPAGATLDLDVGADEVTAIVHTVVRPVGGRFGSYSVTERAVAALEPDAARASP